MNFSRMINAFTDFFAYLFNRKEYTQREDFFQFMDYCNTEERVGASRNCFTYVKDIGNYWQTPLQTWERQNKHGKFEGDCDDWAWFFAEMLREKGALFFCVYNHEKGHAICLGPSKKTTICTFGRIYHGTDDIEEIAKYWYDDWIRIRVYKPERIATGYKLVPIETYTREYHPSIALRINNGVDIEDFLNKLSVIDPEIIDLYFESMVDVDAIISEATE